LLNADAMPGNECVDRPAEEPLPTDIGVRCEGARSCRLRVAADVRVTEAPANHASWPSKDSARHKPRDRRIVLYLDIKNRSRFTYINLIRFDGQEVTKIVGGSAYTPPALSRHCASALSWIFSRSEMG
jgi:hypothetical protein